MAQNYNFVSVENNKPLIAKKFSPITTLNVVREGLLKNISFKNFLTKDGCPVDLDDESNYTLEEIGVEGNVKVSIKSSALSTVSSVKAQEFMDKDHTKNLPMKKDLGAVDYNGKLQGERHQMNIGVAQTNADPHQLSNADINNLVNQNWQIFKGYSIQADGEPVKADLSAFQNLSEDQYGCTQDRKADVKYEMISNSKVMKTRKCGFKSAYAGLEIPLVCGVSVSGSRQNNTENESENFNETVLYSYYQPRYQFTLDKDFMILTDVFISKVKKYFPEPPIVLDHEKLTPSQKNGIVELASQYGHFFPSKFTIGATLFTKETKDEILKRKSNLQENTLEANAKGQFALYGVPVQAAAGYKQENQSLDALQQGRAGALANYECNGGNQQMLKDPSKWLESLSDPRLWAVIDVTTDNVRTIYDLCAKALNIETSKKTIVFKEISAPKPAHKPAQITIEAPKPTPQPTYYVVYFIGGFWRALGDAMSSQNSIAKEGPFRDQEEALNVLKTKNRGAIIWDANTRDYIRENNGGYSSTYQSQLNTWAKTNIESKKTYY